MHVVTFPGTSSQFLFSISKNFYTDGISVFCIKMCFSFLVKTFIRSTVGSGKCSTNNSCHAVMRREFCRILIKFVMRPQTLVKKKNYKNPFNSWRRVICDKQADNQDEEKRRNCQALYCERPKIALID